jgi:pimeloyl-ACP methyl ester carboxylesterase
VTLHLEPTIDGNEAGETIVFIQGWPDDASVWDRAVEALRRDHRCVRTTLPNYGGDRTARWGYRTIEIVDALDGFVSDAARGKPVTLVMHDWGCYWGHSVHHRRPELVSRIVGIDASPHFRASTVDAVLGIIAYQWWLLAAFELGGPFGDYMTRTFARVARLPVDTKRLTAWMNYPYRNIWMDLFARRDRALLGDYWPTCPILFVYGENKPFHFHSDVWSDHVRKTGGEVVGLPCGHWVPLEPAFVEVLRKWLQP